MKNSKLYWRTDTAIRAPQVRVIGSEGKQLGIMPKDVAISQAKDVGLTLVEIVPTANPPVAKIVDFGKFRYQEEKKLRKQQKGAKGGKLKEVRLSPFIDDNAFGIKFKKISNFLAKKDKVKAVVVFKGKQMGSKKFGYDILNRLVSEIGEENIAIDMKPKFFGRHLIMIISPRVARGKLVVSERSESNHA